MNEIEQTMKMIRASSSIFTDTIHQFSDKQLQLLSRGPSYVPPCLMYILFSNESMDDISIPSNFYQRALYEKNLIQSIQYSLKKNNLILRRTANNMNTFYVGNIADFETKADRYLTRSEDYEV
ncbi:unnamed protein product, partial [Rotaria sordida]